MLYEFDHTLTESGRRVVCVLDYEAYRRGVARVEAVYFDGVLREQANGSMVRVTLTVPAAVKLRDALAIGGAEASVAARMLGDRLDDMAAEILRSRGMAFPLPTSAPWLAVTV